MCVCVRVRTDACEVVASGVSEDGDKSGMINGLLSPQQGCVSPLPLTATPSVGGPELFGEIYST